MLSPKDFHELYMSVYEGMDADERALKRELAADRRASKMAPSVAAKYASSEAQSAARADKKSKGKHIHGTVDEAVYGGEKKEPEQPKDTRMTVTAADNKAKTKAWQNYTAGHPGYKAAPHLGEDVELDEAKADAGLSPRQKEAARNARNTPPGANRKFDTSVFITRREGESHDSARGRMRRKAHQERRGMTKEELKLELIAQLRERALDAAEKREKKHVFKAIKPSKLAKSYPEKSPKELKSLRYAISTAQAKKNMDTSRSDKRYGVER